LITNLRKDADKYRAIAEKYRNKDEFKQPHVFHITLNYAHGIEYGIEKLERLLNIEKELDILIKL